jgi:hypothetical protein
MIFYEFTLGDVEDPEIYAAQPLCEWQTTEMGEWVMKHCPDPTYQISVDPHTWGYKVIIHGKLTAEDATYFTLKYK